jgi:hypothetical protein
LVKGQNMDANDVAMARRLATQRVLLRKRQPVTRVQHGHIEDLTIVEVVGSEYLEPENVSQWVDDVLTWRGYGQWRGPWAAVLADILEHGRSSEHDAAAAVARAVRLDEWSQWHLFRDLEAIRATATLPEARRLMSAVLAAWEGNRRLPESRPDHPELGELPDPPAPERLRYPTKWGTPAGASAPWLHGGAA